MYGAWYVEDHGKAEPLGPVSTEFVIDALRSSRFSVFVRVCHVGADEWAPLVIQPAFARVVREVAPPPAFPRRGPPRSHERLPLVDRVVLVAVGLAMIAWSMIMATPASFLLGCVAYGIYADAWSLGIRSRLSKGVLTRLSPLGWTLAVLVLAALGLPAYVIWREVLRTRLTSAVFLAIAVVACTLLGGSIGLELGAAGRGAHEAFPTVSLRL